jgi:hypothetical protein
MALHHLSASGAKARTERRGNVAMIKGTSNSVFFHRFCLDTSSGNRVVQPLVAVLDSGAARFADIFGSWSRPPNEKDLAECKKWAVSAANESRDLVERFKNMHKEGASQSI